MRNRKPLGTGEWRRIEMRISDCHIALSKERDKLRDLINELEGLDDSSQRAIESLEAATEALSELV